MTRRSSSPIFAALLVCLVAFVADDGRAQTLEDVLTGRIASSGRGSPPDPTTVTLPAGQGGRATDVLLVPVDNLIHSFDPHDGTYIGVFSSYSGFQWPLEAIQGPDDNIYVSDGWADAVFVLDTNGDYLHTYADASDGLTGLNYGIDFRGNNLFIILKLGTTFVVAEFDGPHSRLSDFITSSKWLYDILFLNDGSCLISSIIDDAIFHYSATGTYLSDVLTGRSFTQVTDDLTTPGDFLTCGNIGNGPHIADFDLSGVIYDDLRPATGIGGWGVHRLGNGNYLLSGMGSTHEIEAGTGRVVATELSSGDGRLIGLATLPPPVPKVDIKVNGQDSGVQVKQGNNATMTIAVEARAGVGVPADVWIAARNAGSLFFTYGGDSLWHAGLGYAFYTGPLVDLTATPYDAPLPLGSYKAWLGIDLIPNGSLDLGSIPFLDSVDFQVVP